MTLTVYSRPGCHLCEEMLAVVARTASRSGLSFTVQEVDISTDPDLEARYGLEIPVLLIDGTKVAKYRIGEAELMRALTSRAGREGREP
jgi:glutaredoxin